jgi:hypothetical protein
MDQSLQTSKAIAFGSFAAMLSGVPSRWLPAMAGTFASSSTLGAAFDFCAILFFFAVGF